MNLVHDWRAFDSFETSEPDEHPAKEILDSWEMQKYIDILRSLLPDWDEDTWALAKKYPKADAQRRVSYGTFVKIKEVLGE